MAKRRPSGDGMVRKREDGRWEGRIVVGHKKAVTPSSGTSPRPRKRNCPPNCGNSPKPIKVLI